MKRLGILLGLVALCGCSSLPFSGPDLERDFEDDVVGLPPHHGFRMTETNGAGRPARWSVAGDTTRKGSERVLQVRSDNRGGTFNLLLSQTEHGPDLEMSVRLRADVGDEDQGGGLVFRAANERNYYVARWNPLEENLRLYEVVDGVRTQLASVEVRTDPRAWHTLGIELEGQTIRVLMDGETPIEHEDDTFTGSGRVGLWTKADAGTSFDDWVVEG